ncbi:hypothetical protein Tco_0551066 [Tanacetum coccineum]
MHQPWRSFAAIINKCLSGKTTALESLRLSRAQILWGMYHKKIVDYVYLLWDDLVYQTKLTQASKGKRIKIVAKGDKTAKKKQFVTKSKGLTVLSEKSSEEEDDDEVNVSKDNDDDADNDDDVDKDDEDDDANNQDDEIPDDANQDDDDDEQTNLDNDGDYFVHPKLSTHDDEARQDEEESDEESVIETYVGGNEDVKAVSSIPGIVDAYLANKMHEAVKTVIQLQSERLRDEAQAENADFLNKLDNNIKKIIKDQVKEQVKAQVSKILPKIEKIVNEQLEDEVMTRSSIESKTSLAIATNLSELEQKKILIEKMESNKSIYRSVRQKNLQRMVALTNSDSSYLDTYRDTFSLKRRSDDEG